MKLGRTEKIFLQIQIKALLMLLNETIEHLDQGKIRVAEQQSDGKWVTNEYAKKAILC